MSSSKKKVVRKNSERMEGDARHPMLRNRSQSMQEVTSQKTDVFKLAERLVRENHSVEEILQELDAIIETDIVPDRREKTKKDVEKIVRLLRKDNMEKRAADSDQLKKLTKTQSVGVIQTRQSAASTKKSPDVKCSVVINAKQMRSSFVERLKKVLTVLTLTNHRNLLNVDAFSVLGPKLQVQFDVTAGNFCSLESLLKNGGLNGCEAACVFAGVCRGLAFLDCNESLRELLPSLSLHSALTTTHILVTAQGVVKLSGYEQVVEITEDQGTKQQQYEGGSVYYDDAMEEDIYMLTLEPGKSFDDKEPVSQRLAELIHKMDSPESKGRSSLSSHQRKILDEKYFNMYSLLKDWDNRNHLDFRFLLYSQFITVHTANIESYDEVLAMLYENFFH